MVAIDPVDHELASFSNIFGSLHDHLGHPIKPPALRGRGRCISGLMLDRAGIEQLPPSGGSGSFQVQGNLVIPPDRAMGVVPRPRER